MIQWIRWEYVAPRLLATVVVVLAIQYGLGILMRVVVVEGGQAAVGAKVELAHARVALFGGRLELHDLRVANPRSPMQNLIQVDLASLDLETTSLLHKRMVVHKGRMSGLQIATPRQSSGALPANNPATDSAALNWLSDEAAELAEDWLEHVAEQFEKDVLNELQSVRLTEQLLARWPQQHKSLETRLKQLKRRGADIQDTYADAQANPLRHVDFLKKLPKNLAKLQQEFVSLAREIEKLPALVDADRRAIVAARKHDQQLIREHLHVDAIDSGALTAYFLRDQLRGPLGELIAWMRWVHDVAEAEPELSDAPRLAGEDILFAGVHHAPDLLIRALELQGTARFHGRPFALEGTLRNLSSASALQSEPMQLRLCASGETPWQLEATIDRTGVVTRDEILFDCQQMALPATSWGKPDTLSLTVAPSIGAINVRLRLEDDRLSGNIQLVQRQLRLTPSVGDKLYAVPVASALQENLGGIDSLALRVTVSGTLDRPQCKLWSNLGPALAEAMVRALERAAEDEATALLAKSQQHVDEQLVGLERRIAESQAALLQPLAGSTGMLEIIVSDHKASGELSTERIGRQLPTGSLFR